MGTRHLLCIIENGETKLAQYGHFDGDPSGAGVELLKILNDKVKMKTIRDALPKMEFIELDELANSTGLSKDELKTQHPHYNHLGVDVLNVIDYSRSKIYLEDYSSYACRSLFCEWAYVIDFDKGRFEVYKGYNTQPLNPYERFYSDGNIDETDHYPVKLLQSYSLSKLPSEDELTCIDY